MAEFLQFAFSGLTVGAVYALIALGLTLICNASDVINFAPGEFRRRRAVRRSAADAGDRSSPDGEAAADASRRAIDGACAHHGRSDSCRRGRVEEVRHDRPAGRAACHAALAIADCGYVIETGRITVSGDAAALLADRRVQSGYLGA